MSLLLALQVYSVRDFAEKDLKGTLEKIKEMGYDGVEFAGLYGNQAGQVKNGSGDRTYTDFCSCSA